MAHEMHCVTILPEQLVIASLKRESIPSCSHFLINTMFFSGRAESGQGFFSYTETQQEISIIMDMMILNNFPPRSLTVYPIVYRAIEVDEGHFGFTESGVASSLAQPLAIAHISFFYLSTSEFDYILVPEEKLQISLTTLCSAFEIVVDDPANVLDTLPPPDTTTTIPDDISSSLSTLPQGKEENQLDTTTLEEEKKEEVNEEYNKGKMDKDIEGKGKAQVGGEEGVRVMGVAMGRGGLIKSTSGLNTTNINTITSIEEKTLLPPIIADNLKASNEGMADAIHNRMLPNYLSHNLLSNPASPLLRQYLHNSSNSEYIYGDGGVSSRKIYNLKKLTGSLSMMSLSEEDIATKGMALLEMLFFSKDCPQFLSYTDIGGKRSLIVASDLLSLVFKRRLLELSSWEKWRGLCVNEGPLGYELTGVVHAISNPLQKARVPMCYISTFTTDYVLVPETDQKVAEESLLRAGMSI